MSDVEMLKMAVDLLRVLVEDQDARARIDPAFEPELECPYCCGAPEHQAHAACLLPNTRAFLVLYTKACKEAR